MTAGVERDVNGSGTGAEASPSTSPFIGVLALVAFYMALIRALATIGVPVQTLFLNHISVTHGFMEMKGSKKKV